MCDANGSREELDLRNLVEQPRRQRLGRRLAIGLLVFFGAFSLGSVLVMNNMASGRRHIVAKSLWLTGNEPATSLLIHDPKGNLKIRMEAGNDYTLLVFYDSNEKKRIRLGQDNQGNPHLSFYDPKEVERVKIEVNQKGPLLTLYDGKGNQISSGVPQVAK